MARARGVRAERCVGLSGIDRCGFFGGWGPWNSSR